MEGVLSATNREGREYTHKIKKKKIRRNSLVLGGVGCFPQRMEREENIHTKLERKR